MDYLTTFSFTLDLIAGIAIGLPFALWIALIIRDRVSISITEAVEEVLAEYERKVS